jgi:hypothetical protein
MTFNSRRTIQSLAVSACAIAGLSATASAQSLNVDFNDPGGFGTTCGPTYAAAGTAGTWNGIDPSLGVPHQLVDKAGVLIPGASLDVGFAMVFPFSFTNAAYAGDDANLMQDLVWSAGQLGGTMTVNGLANGNYTLLTYAMAPDSKVGGLTDVSSAQATTGAQQVGGFLWTGAHVLGASYSSHEVVVTNNTLDITAVFVAFGESINGFQLEMDTVPVDPGTAYCLGDGTGGPCPCANFGGPGEGCANSGGTGVILSGSGATGTGAGDTLVLDVVGVPGAKPGLLLRGDNQISALVGGGILCLGANSQRSQVQITDASGATTFSDWNGAGFESIANAGVPTQLQFWYRDPSSPCAGTNFNFSNGYSVTYP